MCYQTDASDKQISEPSLSDVQRFVAIDIGLSPNELFYIIMVKGIMSQGPLIVKPI